MTIKTTMLAALFALLLTFSACSGPAARESLLSPAVRQAWQSVASDVERGIADGVDDGDLAADAADELRARLEAVTAAIESQSVTRQTSLVWSGMLITWARRGVQDRLDDGELGLGGSRSFHLRIDEITEAIALLAASEGGAP